MSYKDLHEFVAALEQAGELVRVKAPVDPLLVRLLGGSWAVWFYLGKGLWPMNATRPAIIARYAEKIPFLRTMPTKVLVNVAGHSLEEYVAVAAALDEHECVAGIELNVSCPNIKEGGAQFGTDVKLLSQVVAACRKATKLPLITNRRTPAFFAKSTSHCNDSI